MLESLFLIPWPNMYAVVELLETLFPGIIVLGLFDRDKLVFADISVEERCIVLEDPLVESFPIYKSISK